MDHLAEAKRHLLQNYNDSSGKAIAQALIALVELERRKYYGAYWDDDDDKLARNL